MDQVESVNVQKFELRLLSWSYGFDEETCRHYHPLMEGNRLPLHTEPGFVASGLNAVVVGKPVARTHLEIILAASPWSGALRLSVYMELGRRNGSDTREN